MNRRFIALLSCLCLAGCTPLFFQPMRDHVRTPEQIGLAYEDVTLTAADGVTLHAWFLPARAPSHGTILFLHGNAENVSTHIGSVYWLPEKGFNVLLLDYRGYGQSQGVPTLNGVMRDVDSAVAALLARADVDPDRIVVFGQSLGGSVALHYVAHSEHHSHIRALIVESAFANYRAIVREKLASFWLTWLFQWLPWITVDGDHDPLAAAPRISPIPLLIIHGDRDAIVPVSHGQRLHTVAREPKELWIVPGGNHIDAFRFPEYRGRFVAYLKARLGGR